MTKSTKKISVILLICIISCVIVWSIAVIKSINDAGTMSRKHRPRVEIVHDTVYASNCDGMHTVGDMGSNYASRVNWVKVDRFENKLTLLANNSLDGLAWEPVSEWKYGCIGNLIRYPHLTRIDCDGEWIISILETHSIDDGK